MDLKRGDQLTDARSEWWIMDDQTQLVGQDSAFAFGRWDRGPRRNPNRAHKRLKIRRALTTPTSDTPGSASTASCARYCTVGVELQNGAHPACTR